MASFLLTPKVEVSRKVDNSNKKSLNIQISSNVITTVNDNDSSIFTQATPKEIRKVHFIEDLENEKSFENRLGMLSEEVEQHRTSNKHAMRKVNQLTESLSATKKIADEYRAHVDLLVKENQILKSKMETHQPVEINLEHSLQTEEINLQHQIDNINKEIIKLNQQISTKQATSNKKLSTATESISIDEDAEMISRLSQLEDEKLTALKLLDTKKVEKSKRILSQKNKISELSRRLAGYQAEKNSLLSLLSHDRSSLIDMDEEEEPSSKSYIDNKLRLKTQEVDIIMSEIRSLQQETVTGLEINADIQYIKSRLDSFQTELFSITNKHKKKASRANLLNEAESETLSEAFLLLKERNEENRKLAERLATDNLKYANRLEIELKKNLTEETTNTLTQLDNQLQAALTEEDSIKTQINENKLEITNLKKILESLKSEDVADATAHKEEETKINSILATHEINKLKAEEQIELKKKENLEKIKLRKRQTGELFITLQEYESDKERLLQSISTEKGNNKEKSRSRIAKQKSLKYQSSKQEQEIAELTTTLQNYEIQQLDEEFNYKSEFQIIKDRLDVAKEELKVFSSIKKSNSSIFNNNTTTTPASGGIKRTISRARGASENENDLLKRQPSIEKNSQNDDILQILNRDSSDPSLLVVPSSTGNSTGTTVFGRLSGNSHSLSFYKKSINDKSNNDVMNIIYETDHTNHQGVQNHQWQAEREALIREVQSTKKDLERLSLVLESSVNRHIKEADKLSDLLAEWTAQSQSWAMELIIMHEKSHRDHLNKSTSPIRSSKNSPRGSLSPKTSNLHESKALADAKAAGPIYDNKALQMRVQYLEIAVRRWEKEHIRWDMQKKYFENKLKLNVAELTEMTSAFRRSQLELEMLRCTSTTTTTTNATSTAHDSSPNKTHPGSAQSTPVSTFNGSFSGQFISQTSRDASTSSNVYNPRWNEEQSPVVLREILKSICAQFQTAIQSQTVLETEKRIAEEKLAVLLNQLGMISRQQQQSDLDLHTLKTGMTRFARRTADLAVSRSTELQQQLLMEELVDLGAALGAGIEIPKSSPKVAVMRPRSSAPAVSGFRNRRGNSDAPASASSAIGTGGGGGPGEGRAASPWSAQLASTTADPMPAAVRRPRPKSSSATPSILFNRSVDSSRGMDIDFDVDFDAEDRPALEEASVVGRQRATGGGGRGTVERSQPTNRANSRNGNINKENNYNSELIEEDNEDEDDHDLEINGKTAAVATTAKPSETSHNKDIRPVFKPSRPRPRSSAGYKSTGDSKSSQTKMSATAGDVSAREAKAKGRPSSGNFYFRPSSGVAPSQSNHLTKE